MKNKEIESAVSLVFKRYQVYKIRLNNLAAIEFFIDKKQIPMMCSFVKYIEEILDTFNESDKRMIKNIYIENKPLYDLCCSKSSFYYKKSKYNDILYKYLFEEF